jgi:hypothetical protein
MRKTLVAVLVMLCGGHAFAVTPDDYVQIKQLYAAYAMAQDSGDRNGVASLFAPGGTIADGNHAAQPVADAATRLTVEDHRWGWDRHILSSAAAQFSAQSRPDWPWPHRLLCRRAGENAGGLALSIPRAVDGRRQ